MTSYITGIGLTSYGRQPGRDSLDWQIAAAQDAVRDADADLNQIDAVLTGYSTVSSHLMPANLFAERFGLRPLTAFGVSSGGATGLAMLAQATHLISAGAARHVLLVAGENRATGQTRATSTNVLAGVGHAEYEVPLGATVPAYYALLASWYQWRHALPEHALAPLPVQMREHARGRPGAHFHTPISIRDVAESRAVAEPLRLLDCCPISDGGAAFVISAEATSERDIEVAGTGQAHRHQHVSALEPGRTGAAEASERALSDAGLRLSDIDVFGIYDSFSITLAMIVEELGIAPPGRASSYACVGAFAADGRYPMNTHGGLLSYGHPGVAGGLAHLAEVVTQLRGECDSAQVREAGAGYVHADGGVLSAHIGVVLKRRYRL